MGFSALDPNKMCLEVPYQNQELYWIEGEMIDEKGASPIYVPAQFVFLFPNLDEISLTTGLPSTGLGAGNSIAQAKVSGLLEVIERDSEKVVPYSRDRGFILESKHPDIIDILEGTKQKGIYIQFSDITSEFGIPCYRAFVQGPGGVILKGSAANLDARHAAVAAMTEIPYPYPYWFGSMEPPERLKVLQYEELPDFSSGNAEEDKSIIENVLIANGYRPIYVDLTREDLNIPVIKALVPGLEITAAFDRYSPIGFRHFAHYHTSA
jgi:ribosomal protein S12 methylthiotransferase accessory factor YcaO